MTGSDSNSGRTPGQALATFAPISIASGLDIRVVPSPNALRDILDTGNKSGIRLIGAEVGEHYLPVVTVFDVVDPASWTPVEGYPNTYSTTVAHDITEGTSAETLLVEDDVILARKTSIASVDANPGSFHSPHDAAVASNDPYTVYYHASDSSDPRTNGKTVEANARDHAIEDVEASANHFEGLHLRGCGVDDGCMDGGADVTLKRILFTKGGKHHIVFRSGLLEDCVTGDYDPTWPQAIAPYTAYSQSDPAALDVVLRRCFGIDISSFLSHFGTGSYYASTLIEEFIGAGLNPAALDSAIRRGWLVGSRTGADLSLHLPGTALSISHVVSLGSDQSIVRCGTVGGDPAVDVAISHLAAWFSGSASGSRFPISAGVNSPLDVAQATLAGRDSGFALRGLNTLTANKSLVVLTAGYQFVEAGPSFAGDDNIYVMVGSGNFQFRLNGTTYTNSFAAWQSATGADANSEFFTITDLADVFTGDPAAGDFSINDQTAVGQAILAAGAGMTEHWDFNSRSITSAPPSSVPVPPATLAEAEAYVLNPRAWSF